MRHFLQVLPLLAMAQIARADDHDDAKTVVAFEVGHVFGGFDHTVVEWDASTGTVVRTITWPGRWIALLSVTRDGKLVVGSDDFGKIVVWDVGQNKAVRTMDAGNTGGDTAGMDVSSDGRVVAITSYLDVKLFDLATGKLLRAIKMESSGPSAVKFAPDSKTLAILSPGLQFYSAAGERLADFSSSVKESPGRQGAHTVAWTPDGTRVVDAGGHLTIADPKTPHVLGDLDHGQGSNGHHLVILADGKWAALSLDGQSSGKGGIAWYTLPSLTFKATWSLDNVSGMALGGDGKVLAVGQPDGVVKLVDPSASKLAVVRTLKVPTAAP